MKVQNKERETGACTKFRLLMWKNFLQQWRNKKQTIAELTIPVLTISLVLILRSQIHPTVVDTINYPPLASSSLNSSRLVISGLNFTQLSVAYSPRSDELDDILRTAIARLILGNLRPVIDELLPLLPENITTGIPPDILNNTNIEFLKRFVNLTAYNSSAELRGIYVKEEATRRVIAAVEFSDDLLGATQLPINLSYALRFPERPRQNSFFQRGGRTWRTDLLFPIFEMPGPRYPRSWEGGNDPGYVNEMFIALQQSISSELITRVTGRDMNDYSIYIQRYPHPPYLDDLANEALQALFPTIIILSFCYTAVNIVRAVTLEKELQLKETMKIMGLPTWLHWTAWFCKQIIYLLISSVFIILIVKVNWFTTEDGFSAFAVFTNTPWDVLFFFLLLYFMCTIFFCFMLSGFFSKANTAALFTGIIWFLTYIPAFLLSIDVNMSTWGQALTCLSINSAMAYGFQLMLARESTGGLQWGEFMQSPATDGSRFLFGHVVIMLAVDCVLYMMIALYLEQIMPGPFGTPRPWYFLLQRDFWLQEKANTGTVLGSNAANDLAIENNVTKEDDPSDLTIGVQMRNLTKIYGANAAVNNLSLNIYNDQITVLLGHNGAGKSTTISMLTGNVEITSGVVIVSGYDISKQTSLARSHIGLCPQHNVLFDTLTVREHLEFFSRLKGFKGQELIDDINSMITKLELDEKKNYQAYGLSGGQKRRLAVGIALCGGARVVLLDEPTSGMDPASRRALWDLLQKEKIGRSIILTTHFMDEADILGDRVAIMAEGQLQCVGSPFFLKRHYGVGYTLVVVKKENFDIDACTAHINNYIPGTTVKEDRGTEVTYGLTNENSYIFKEMLENLENNATEINFSNYGLIATTLEDVFMSVGSDIPLDESETATVTNFSDVPSDFQSFDKLNITSNKDVEGVALVWQHMRAMWLKLWLVWIKSWPLVLMQIFIPAAYLSFTLGILQYIMSMAENIQRRELTLTKGFTNTETLMSFNGTSETSTGALAQAAYEQTFVSADIPSMNFTNIGNQSIDSYYLNRTADPSEMGRMRNQLLIGATFDDNVAVAWFSNFGYHDVANSLAAVHAALLRAFVPEAHITVYNHPIEANYANQNDMQLMVSFLSMQVANAVGTSLGIVSAVFIMFYIKERFSRAKLLQKAAGIRPVVMWGSAAIFDWLWFCLLSIGIIICLVAFNVVGMSSLEELGRLYICIMVYGAAMLPINYVCSYFFGGPAVGFVAIFFANVLFGMLGAQIVEALYSPQLDTERVADVLDSILQFFPLYGLVTSVRLLNQGGLLEWSCMQSCDYLAAILPNMQECTLELLCNNFFEQCCIEEDNWWDWKEGILRYVIYMLVTGAVMWGVLMIAEYRLLQKIFNRTRKPPPLKESELDNDVVDEMRHVENVGKGFGHSLVAKGLTKYYGNNLAVDQVSFTVSDTECFGLLGVNGAGKTTTFKMLMGDETISSGDAFVGGHSVKTNITKVHENIGYCPQFDAVFPELTGRETLRFFSMLRGLRPETSDVQAEALAHALGFRRHFDKRVEVYSGGNKRKLSTAVTLLGRTRLVFVDEPTTGVDPAAKRQVWNAMQDTRKSGRGVVLTSHSMEECEALCSRLTIMVNGRFQCLGTPQHLKNKFSEGFTLLIKLRVNEETRSVSQETCDAVKNFVNTNFKDPKIMEEYQGLLTYYLPDKSVAWSRMFGLMETAKQELEVEDYSISQTSLEQIFLQFTKYQRNVQDS